MKGATLERVYCIDGLLVVILIWQFIEFYQSAKLKGGGHV